MLLDLWGASIRDGIDRCGLIGKERDVMGKRNKRLTIIVALLAAGCVPVLLFILGITFAEDSPRKEAVAFAKAYFAKSPLMVDRICKARRTGADLYAIDDLLQDTADEARARGVGLNFMASMLYRIDTETEYVTESEANVRITGKRRTAINPIYPYVAIVFNIGETYTVDDTIRMIREDGQWKVCESLSSVFQDI